MKRILLLLTAMSFSVVVLAQGNSGGKNKEKQQDKTEQNGKEKENKGKEKDKENGTGKNMEEGKDKENKDKKEVTDHARKVWDGAYTKESDAPKPSKNQPANVQSSFQKDYPTASGITWSKYRGDWTATFRNGASMSTAVYHANGERKDTRTPITRNEMPKKVVDSIFKRRPNAKLEDVVKVEAPKGAKEIYRVKDVLDGKPQYLYYDSDGLPVKYDY